MTTSTGNITIPKNKILAIYALVGKVGDQNRYVEVGNGVRFMFNAAQDAVAFAGGFNVDLAGNGMAASAVGSTANAASAYIYDHFKVLMHSDKGTPPGVLVSTAELLTSLAGRCEYFNACIVQSI